MADLPPWAVLLPLVLAAYVLLVAALVTTGRRAAAREAALLIPNLVRLFHGLLRDPGVPWHAKAVLALGLGYFAVPIDLVPDFIPVAGALDDAIVASLVLAYVVRVAGPTVVERHWHGDPRVLRHLVTVSGSPARRRVLFLCIRNSARSQMAEALLRSLAPDRFEVYSAGVSAGTVWPEAIEVMREVGIDISGHRGKAADEYAGQKFDLVVTTCDEAREVCPLFPGATRMLHWSIADPVVANGDARWAAFRAARDELRSRIEREILAG